MELWSLNCTRSQPTIGTPVLAGHATVWAWGGRFPVEGGSCEPLTANTHSSQKMDALAVRGMWAELQQHPLQKAWCHLWERIDMDIYMIVHAQEPCKSRGSYPRAQGSLRPSWVESYFNVIGFLCNTLYFILPIFKHYSEKGIHRFQQRAKGSMVHTEIKRFRKGVTVFALLRWQRGRY